MVNIMVKNIVKHMVEHMVNIFEIKLKTDAEKLVVITTTAPQYCGDHPTTTTIPEVIMDAPLDSTIEHGMEPQDNKHIVHSHSC